MQWSAVVVVALASVVKITRGNDGCPPVADHYSVHAKECCTKSNLKSTNLTNTVKKCMGQNPELVKSFKSGPMELRHLEMMEDDECFMECTYAEEGLLTPDRKLDLAANRKFVVFNYGDDPEMFPVMSAAVDKCYHQSLSRDVDTSMKCKSGAGPFNQCLARELLFNCPKAKWAGTAECEESKEKVEKCSNITVYMVETHPSPKQ